MEESSEQIFNCLEELGEEIGLDFLVNQNDIYWDEMENSYEFKDYLEECLNKVSKNYIDLRFLCVFIESYLGVGETETTVYFKEKNDVELYVKSFLYELELYEIESNINIDFFNDDSDIDDFDECDNDDNKTVIHLFGNPYLVNRKDCEKFIVMRTNKSEDEVKTMSDDEIDEWVNEADVCVFLDRYHSEKI